MCPIMMWRHFHSVCPYLAFTKISSISPQTLVAARTGPICSQEAGTPFESASQKQVSNYLSHVRPDTSQGAYNKKLKSEVYLGTPLWDGSIPSSLTTDPNTLFSSLSWVTFNKTSQMCVWIYIWIHACTDTHICAYLWLNPSVNWICKWRTESQVITLQLHFLGFSLWKIATINNTIYTYWSFNICSTELPYPCFRLPTSEKNVAYYASHPLSLVYGNSHIMLPF